MRDSLKQQLESPELCAASLLLGVGAALQTLIDREVIEQFPPQAGALLTTGIDCHTAMLSTPSHILEERVRQFPPETADLMRRLHKAIVDGTLFEAIAVVAGVEIPAALPACPEPAPN